MKRASLFVALTLIAVAIGGTGERATSASRPNVVLIVTDDQRWDMVAGVMPIMASRLVAHGIYFQNAFVTDPWCCPSRASILTGLYPHSHGVYSNENGPTGGFQAFDDSSTLATWLNDAGYRTGLFGKYLNGYDTATGGEYIPPGWDQWFAFVDGRLDDFRVSDNGVVRRWVVYSTDLFGSEAADFIRESAADEPLFVMVTPIAPHLPARPAERHAGRFADALPYRPPSYEETDVTDKPAWVQAIEPARPTLERSRDRKRIHMLESLLAVDDAVGEILMALEETGRLENTLIVFTSDNGFQLSEHRLWGKAQPYEGSTHVPLVMRFDAAVTGPASVSRVVANIDLAPTIASAVGVTPPDPVEGLDLSPLFADPLALLGRRGVLIEHGLGGRAPPFCSFRTANDLYTRLTTGEEEFYRYDEDPYELQNLITLPTVQRVVHRRRATTQSLCDPLPPGMVWQEPVVSGAGNA
jgi:N-acetylglucosamine-6-sulfatase